MRRRNRIGVGRGIGSVEVEEPGEKEVFGCEHGLTT